MKKFLCVMLVLAVCAAAVAGCGGDPEHGDPKANTAVPNGYQTLEIAQESNGNRIVGVGVELDPHFLSSNVGLSGTFQPDSGLTGERWEVKETDWEEIFVPRMREMGIKRFRSMVLPHYYCDSQSVFESKSYRWDSVQMKSLYQVLDTAQQLDVYVNLTMWGVDTRQSAWLAAPDNNEWCGDPAEGKEKIFTDLFADLIKYLIEERGYTCVKEVTLYNEPNAFYGRYGVSANRYYVEICRQLDASFREAGIRDRVLFNLSDDARDATWLGQTAAGLEGVADILNSHTYDFTADHTNAQIRYELPAYSLKSYMDALDGYDIPHMFGEFGTGNVVPPSIATDRHTPERGLQIPRIALNMLYMGSSGFSHWPLYSQYYDRPSSNNITAKPFEIMNMGLWGYADEKYAPRPVFYSYSLLCRYVLKDSDIFPIETNDDNLVAVAVRSPEGKWSYLVVNDSADDKNISFLNRTKFPQSMKRYVYDSADPPTDGRQIASDKTIAAKGRVVSDTVAGKTFAVYSDL